MDVILDNVPAHYKTVGPCTVTVIRYNRRHFNIVVNAGWLLSWRSTSIEEVVQQLKRNGITLNA